MARPRHLLAIDQGTTHAMEGSIFVAGAAFLAGLATGIWPDLPAIAESWSAAARFTPGMDDSRRMDLLAGWKTAVRRTLAT